MEVVELVVSPVRRYDGRPAEGPLPFDEPPPATVAEVRAHLGIKGDRYFGRRHPRAAVTFISLDELETALTPLGVDPVQAAPARRNVVLRGIDVEALLHTTFTLDSGDGPLRFVARTRANPCAWMDEVYAPGAHRALRGHAGIRTEPLDDGILRVGPVRLLDVEPLPADQIRTRRRSA